MKEYNQETDYYQHPPPIATTMQGIEKQLKKSSQLQHNGTGNGLLGKFLKLGKSKSDVHASNFVKRRAGVTSSSGGDELEDDFVLAPVQLRGVEKMVHRANGHGTKKDNVSRSHSWIYGSVKLPSDLPFGYGGYDPSASSPSGHHVNMSCSSQSNSNGNLLQIPRFQTGGDFYSCSCDEEYCKFLSSGNPQVLPPPCQACQLVPGSNRKSSAQLQALLAQPPETSKKFGNSVRKLTWKSLKQAVKKRPSLESIIKRQPEGVGTKDYANYCSSQDDFFHPPTPNYFFPEKKSNSYYASCTDLIGPENPHVTASVRVRPKRSRATWNFPNEFGPVPNYQEQEGGPGIYHSEWDLRQCMPYEQWLTSSNPITGTAGHDRSSLDDIFSSPVVISNVKITNGNNNSHNNRVNKPNNEMGMKTTNGTVGNHNGISASSKGGGGGSKAGSSDLYTNGGVKRFSILHNEGATAYQLNKNDEEDDDGESEAESTEGGSGPPLLTTESGDPVRIAGQGIFMLPGVANGGHGQGSVTKVARSNSTSSAKYKNSGSFGPGNNTSKGNHPHHLLLGAARSEADGIWSDTQTVEELPPAVSKESPSSSSPHVNRDRKQVGHHDKVEIEQKIQLLKTFKQPNTKNGHNDLPRLNGNSPGPDGLSPSVTTIKPIVESVSKNGVGEKESLYAKNQTTITTNGKGIKSAGKRGNANGETENKYGALRRRRGRASAGGKNNLLRETIYEEESENGDHPDENHAVKIIVSRTGGLDYVKPILKTRIATSDGESAPEIIYDDETSPIPSRTPKKVQFNSTEEFVQFVQNSTEDSESCSDEGEDDPEVTTTTQPTTTTTIRNSWVTDHDSEEYNDHVNPVDDHGERNKEQPPSPPPPVQKETGINRKVSVIKNQEEVPHLCRVKVGKEKSLTSSAANEVNNLEAFPQEQLIQQLQQKFTDETQETTKMIVNGDLKKSEGSSREKMTEDEKMILSKFKRIHNSKVISRGERIIGDPPQEFQIPPGNEKNSQLTETILNPNSLLFNDTTRIRLNQTRPSVQSTFQYSDYGMPEKAISSNSNASGSSRKIRPSQSFRHLSNPTVPGSLRPKDPPPPPPRISSALGLPRRGPSPQSIYSGGPRTKSQISLPIPMLGFSTTNDLVKEPKVVPSHYQNGSIGKPRSKSLVEKCEVLEKVLGQQKGLRPHGYQGDITLEPKKNNDLSEHVTTSDNNSEVPKIEIVTRENSVSEIRIYSSEKPVPAPKNPNLASKREMHYATSDLFQRPKVSETSSHSHHRSPSQPGGGGHSPPSRPQSTSVVLIIDTSSADVTGNSIMTNQNLRSTDQIPGVSIPPPLPPVNVCKNLRNEDKRQGSLVGQQGKMNGRQVESKREIVYDDVINNHSHQESFSSVGKQKEDKPCPVPPDFSPPHSPSPSRCQNGMSLGKRASDVDSIHSVYSDVGTPITFGFRSQQNLETELVYDDTLTSHPSSQGSKSPPKVSLPSLVSHRGSSDESTETLVEDEPLYDDISNVMDVVAQVDSDSGTETDVPPPLPSSGPPLHLLPEISLELPVIPLPGIAKSGKGSISKGTSRLLGEIIEFSKKISGIGSGGGWFEGNKDEGSDLGERSREVTPVAADPCPPADERTIKKHPRPLFLPDFPEEDPVLKGSPGSDDVLDRTRTLLNELNEKLANLNFSPEDYSTYISKVLISSSSESSGVEEDYNSEKNYDGGSGSSSTTSAEVENYKLSKLVSDTISMARGKFLDSMKISNNNGRNSNGGGGNGGRPISTMAGSDTEEPIYEEINDSSANNAVLRSTSPIYADAFDAKSIFDGASRNEILSFLESIRDRLTATADVNPGNRSTPVTKVKKIVEIERNDSGIGSETNSILAIPPLPTGGGVGNGHLICQDCHDSPVEAHKRLSGDLGEIPPSFCRSCFRKRSERKEIVQEIYETELKYGRDLRIISDEFYTPIQTAGLLSRDQLDAIFLNVGQLIEVSGSLSSSLKTAITGAIGNGGEDEDLNSVNVGRIFLEIGEKMMSAFESYCTRQASAGALLTQIEKEKELLRIFLRVSQMENTVLRRMNLPAFLMVPVQRVTRYPLLLSRLLKVTAPDHPTRDELQLAHERIEQHLEHMNNTAREVASVKLWRRISIINGPGTTNNGGLNNNNNSSSSISSISPANRRSNSDFDGAGVRIRKMALDILDWSPFKDVSCVIESQLNLQSNNGKTLRPIYAILLARGKDLEKLALRMDQDLFFPPKEDVVKDVKLVLVRAKNARFSFFREPLCLGKCVISRGEAEFQDFIEINEITTKNTYHLQGMDRQGTCLWLKLLQSHAVCVGQWRRRRGALANIMMNGMVRRPNL